MCVSVLGAGSPVLLGKGWPDLPAGLLAPPGVSRRMVNNEKTRLWSYSPPPGIIEKGGGT